MGWSIEFKSKQSYSAAHLDIATQQTFLKVRVGKSQRNILVDGHTSFKRFHHFRFLRDLISMKNLERKIKRNLDEQMFDM